LGWSLASGGLKATERIHNACKKALISALVGPISKALDALSGDAKGDSTPKTSLIGRAVLTGGFSRQGA
jgi:hypothetical protein